MSSKDAGAEGDEAVARLERELARLMSRVDNVVGLKPEPTDENPLEAPLDPELERDIQLAVLHFLSQRTAATGEAEPAGLTEDERINRAMSEHVRPLFDVIFATAHAHARAASEAIKKGRDPSTRPMSGGLSIDVSDILEDDS